MCGFYGKVAARGAVDFGQALTALQSLRHRGPDHMGWHQETALFLGHVRLAILDPTPEAHQPFHEGKDTLLTNGEIYNYRELAAALPGEIWRSHCDTEVAMRLLRREGHRALGKFNGMFALAFWDASRRSLLLARDRLGIKPLYWRFQNDQLEFASEIKAFAPAMRRDALREVLAFGHFEAGCLPWKGVQELPPGYSLSYVPGELPKVAPWLEALAPPAAASQASDAAAASPVPAYPLAGRVSAPVYRAAAKSDDAALAVELRALLEKSVDLHLRSDAPLGALCSGGLDSTVIAALAKKHRPDMRLYHCGSAEGGGEEAYAEQAARHLGLPLRIERMDKATYWRLFPKVTWHHDMPIYHPNDVSLYHIAARAHQDGIKVLLAGEGADELFGGYAWHGHFNQQLRASRRLGAWGRWRDRAETLWQKAAGKAHYPGDNLASLAPYGPGYPGSAAAEVLQGLSLGAQGFRAFSRWQELRPTYQGLASGQEAAVLAFLLEDMHGHLGTLLHRADRVLMGLSIEGRVPFLENDLIDFAMNLPLSAKIRGSQGKFLLKRVAESLLPPALVHRPKQGFPVAWQGYLPAAPPEMLQQGFVREWTGFTQSALRAAYALSPAMAFRLLAIEVFGRLFAWGESPEALEVV